MHPEVVIVIPGDDPPQLQGSPHLERLKSHGDVILHVDRPPTVEDQVRRAGPRATPCWSVSKWC